MEHRSLRAMAATVALTASRVLWGGDDPGQARAAAVAQESAWIRLDNVFEAKLLRDSVRFAKDRPGLASYDVSLRAGYGQRSYFLLSTEVSCLSAPRSFRFLTIDTVQASGAPLKHFEKQEGWTLALPEAVGRYLTSLCDSPMTVR